jgi:C-terminal peptidase prc
MTRVMLKGLLTALALAVAAALPARAAEPEAKAAPAPTRAYVVLVGISDYADPQIKPRPHAEADAKALYDIFSDKKYQADGTTEVRLLLGKPDAKRPSEPATRANIIKALSWVAKEARRDDLVVFAFFGQGGPFADRVCYFASDSTFKGRTKDAVAAGDVEHEMEKLKSQHFCAFLDVNFKGYDSKGEQVTDATHDSKLYQEFMGTEENTSLAGRVLFLATDGFTPTVEGKGHGLFARLVTTGLKGAADKEGYEPDGLVTVDELADYLNKQLPAQARKLGATPEEQEQQHHILRTRATSFVLTQNPAVSAGVTKRLAKLAELTKEGKLSKELADEGQKLIRRMPKLKAQRELRRSYQRLLDGELSMEDFTKKRTEILASTKLKRATALAFASKVIRASQVVKEGYVKEKTQGELVEWGVRGLYRRIDEPIPSDLRERLDKAKDMTEEELTTLLADVRERLGQREDLANHQDLDFTLQRMLRRLDPYTDYIDPEKVSRFKQDTDGRFTGIGIQIRGLPRDSLTVITPLKDSPAYKAGIKAGDVITQIIREVDAEGKPLEKPEIVPTKGMSINDAVKNIQGKPGTKVKLTVEREGAGSLEFEVTRDTIEVETVLGYKRLDNDEWDYWIDPSNQIAYVRLTSFARNTARDLSKLMARLEKKGVRGFILDLRFNPGGLLTSAVEIADLFIDDGLIVTIRPRGAREQPYVGEHQGSYLNFPMVCLVNGLSASGSEIVSACLQDHKRAVIMGERSYGKGSVQNIQPFEGGELKLTTASFWRPSGKNLNKSSTGGKDSDEWGVTPDKGYTIKLENRERDQLQKAQHDSEIIPRRDLPAKPEAKSDFKDRQLEAALQYLRGQIKTASRNPVKKAG